MALLRHTTKGPVVERQALTVNPAKTCQPVGAMYASLGIRGCLPHSHGSQGCCAYHRSALSKHYKEPVMAATSSFTEGSSVFGGQANLLEALENIFKLYNPEVIAVHTTCLSETIGDDIPQIVEKARESGKVPEGKYIIHANTPSYVGAAPTGFANMTTAMVEYFAESEYDEKPAGHVNILPGWVEPADMREIRRLAELMQLKVTMYPDTSGVLDAPQTGVHHMFPDGGTAVEDIRRSGDATATIALGQVCSAPAARALSVKCGVDSDVMTIPYGLQATDRMIMALRKYNGGFVPKEIMEERGRLLDLMCDMHQYFHNKTVALWGDPDQLVGLTEFLMSVDVLPKYVITGTPGKKFARRVGEVLGARAKEAQIRQGGQADMFLLHQWIKNDPVDLLIGNTYGKYIARDEDIPLMRHGFPIIDRIGHQYFPTVGYRGAIRMLERMLDLFLDRADRDATEEGFELTQ